MNCPLCGQATTKVRDSRTTADGGRIARRRVCENCGHRFSTAEVPVGYTTACEKLKEQFTSATQQLQGLAKALSHAKNTYLRSVK